MYMAVMPFQARLLELPMPRLLKLHLQVQLRMPLTNSKQLYADIQMKVMLHYPLPRIQMCLGGVPGLQAAHVGEGHQGGEIAPPLPAVQMSSLEVLILLV